MQLSKNPLFHAAVRHVAPHQQGRLRRGFGLLKSRQVSVFTKLLALGIGVAITLLLVALEAPLETIFAFMVPFGGAIVDVAFDGVEMVALPILFACLVLPSLVREGLKG